jgi:hypothetical protein
VTSQNTGKARQEQRLKEELRSQILREIETDLQNGALQKRENAFREELRNENRSYLINFFFYACALSFGPLIWYFFPDLDPRIGMTIGILIGAAFLFSFFAIRSYGLRRLLKTYPRRSVFVTLALCCALVSAGIWAVSGRPARLVEESKSYFIEGQNRFNKLLGNYGSEYELEPDGSLGIRCYDETVFNRYESLGKKNPEYDSILNAGFDRVILYDAAGSAGERKRLEIKLK